MADAVSQWITKKFAMKYNFLLSMPGGTEWILIILAVLILFGGRKIPEFMRGIGKGIREFNDAKNNVKKEIEDGMNERTNRLLPVNNSRNFSTHRFGFRNRLGFV